MLIHCVNTKTDIEVNGGSTLAEILNSGVIKLPFDPICARVNNKTESLHYPLYGPKMVEFISPESASGQRVYIRSLCMMLYKAVTEVLPGTRLKVAHSIAKGYYCRLDGVEITDELLDKLRSHMRRMVEEKILFKRNEKPTEQVIEIFKAEGLNDKVELLKTLHELYTVYYTLGDTADSYNSALAPCTSYCDVFDLVHYKNGFLLMGPSSIDTKVAFTPVMQEKMYKAFSDYSEFNHIIGVTNAGNLNRAIEEGRSPMIVNVAEALHEKSIANISDAITSRYHDGGARIVLIAGPSSSGKTTFTKRLSIQLMTNLLVPRMISLDDYFVNRDKTPRDEDGELDYESLYALDIEQFNKDLNDLLDGKEVQLPTYSFELGQRTYKESKKMKLCDNSVLLIEGIHGLNPELTAAVEEKMKYRVYVSALTTIAIDDHNWVPTTDNRLLRRIVRDYKYRGTSPIDTIKRWPSVRRGEEKWIFPFQENADIMFNSSLLFEMSVMKERAEQVLRTVPQDVSEYTEAYRLRRFLNYFKPINAKLIPPTSLLREFLGGSTFQY